MESRSKGFALTSLIVAGIGASLLATLVLLNRRDETVSLSNEIQYDDFAFSVLSVRQAESVGKGDGLVKPAGLFYIVTLKIANHAVRVDYNYKRSCPLLVDEHGNEHPPSPEAQPALEETLSPGELCYAPIPAGASCVTEVVFDVPAGVRVTQLRITFGPIADILDPIFSGRKRIALTPVMSPAENQ
ncbi:MAG TPA: DUF4352 domain-containing protein [Blastocatellia bacterium]|jgi:hypothetical protein|nr:DUF4352 domain-containing protein [Blastocatellia bacterium]